MKQWWTFSGGQSYSNTHQQLIQEFTKYPFKNETEPKNHWWESYKMKNTWQSHIYQKASWWSPNSWEIIQWTDEMKLKPFGRSALSSKNNNIILTFKHDGGNVMIWGCFATSCLKTKFWISCESKITVLEWSSQSLNLNMISILWDDLNRPLKLEISSMRQNQNKVPKEEFTKVI